MVSMLFRDPQALSSDLILPSSLQPRAFGSLNHVETLDSASNHYLEQIPGGAQIRVALQSNFSVLIMKVFVIKLRMLHMSLQVSCSVITLTRSNCQLGIK